MSGGFVGTLTTDLHLPEATSLKDKRTAVRGLKAALTKATGCAVAEVDDHDVRRRARISLAVVAASSAEAVRLLEVAERVVFSGPFEVLATERTLRSLDELAVEGLEVG